MIIFKKELRQGRISLLVWTLLLTFMMSACVLIYPQMKEQMESFGESFAQMGEFSQAFGLDQLNFAGFEDFLGLECSNVMGLMGAMFASLLGIRALVSEEKEHTAEFLLTHPITRPQVVGEKLLAIAVQVTILNLAVAAGSLCMTAIVGESVHTGRILLLFFSYYLMHLQLAFIAFGISAFLRRGSLAMGIGVGAAAYFLNIISNLIDSLDILKYLTPMGYTDSAMILHQGKMPAGYLAAGMVLLAAGAAAALLKYSKKDIA